MESVAVLIVGGGPVGMNLALDLAALGVGSMIVEREPTTRRHPRGSTQNARTMEHYRRLGLSHRIRDLGLPPDHPTDIAYFTALNGIEITRLPMPSENEKRAAVARAGVTDQVPEPLLRCNQMYVEAFLREHIGTMAAIDDRWGWECTDFVEQGDGVTVRMVDAAGREASVRCRYLVGCDGGGGMIRRRLGIGYVGKRPTERAYASGATISTHIRAPQLYERFIRKKAWHYWVVNPAVRATLVTLDGRGHFLMNSKLRKDDGEPDVPLIAEHFRKAAGGPVEAEFLAHTPWTAGQALVANSYGAGRVLLAGDAVHLFTPTGGFGMNTGVDDVANLGWKLAAVVQGWGGPALLASYELERRPIALRNTAAAKRMSLTNGEVPVGPHIGEDSAAGAADRARAAAMLSGFGDQFGSLGIQLGARYDDSPIVFGSGRHIEDDPEIYWPTAVPGGRAPHAFLPGGSLFDRFGPGFTLLCLRPGIDDAAFEAAAAARHIPLTTVRLDLPAVRDLYECDLALIRPDQHVAWRGNAAPADADAILARATGW